VLTFTLYRNVNQEQNPSIFVLPLDFICLYSVSFFSTCEYLLAKSPNYSSIIWRLLKPMGFFLSAFHFRKYRFLSIFIVIHSYLADTNSVYLDGNQNSYYYHLCNSIFSVLILAMGLFLDIYVFVCLLACYLDSSI